MFSFFFRSFRSRLSLQRSRAWKTRRIRVRLRIWMRWWRKIPSWSIASTFWTGWVDLWDAVRGTVFLQTFMSEYKRLVSVLSQSARTYITGTRSIFNTPPNVGTKLVPQDFSPVNPFLSQDIPLNLSFRGRFLWTSPHLPSWRVSSGAAGGADLLWSRHGQHQPAAPGGLRSGHQDVFPRTGEPSAGPGSQPAAQVWRLPVQQRHGHVPGPTVQTRPPAWNHLEFRFGHKHRVNWFIFVSTSDFCCFRCWRQKE